MLTILRRDCPPRSRILLPDIRVCNHHVPEFGKCPLPDVEAPVKVDDQFIWPEDLIVTACLDCKQMCKGEASVSVCTA